MNKKSSVVIITGAAGGIGRATALKFAANGYALSLVDIDSSGLLKLSQSLNEIQCEYLILDGDLQEKFFLETIIQKTFDKWGRIDVLINNAIWRTIETMRTITHENWEKTLKIGLTAPAFLAKQVAVFMEKKSISGVIINISSIMSQRVGGNSPAYVVCKGGIESLTYELAVLYGPKGIRVITVCPGNIRTDLSSDYKDEEGSDISEKICENITDCTPLKRSGSPGEVANVSYWLCTDDASFITGSSILVDGGFFHNFSSYQMKKLQFPKEF